MGNIKEFISSNKNLFENDPLPQGHRERFMKKAEKQKTSISKMRIIRVVSLAAILMLLASPLIFLHKQEVICNGSQVDYNTLIQEQAYEIKKLSEQLNQMDKDLVIGTLNQLVTEAVPFEEQLPDYLLEKERRMLQDSYYCPRIEGIKRLKDYVADLLDTDN
ncbi:MAG: hypothetical protein EOM61_10000 [Bacteroidia bacterium]|jgi:cell division protein FtsL|nr:hypothetical protein [Bacteroidia bacterium]